MGMLLLLLTLIFVTASEAAITASVENQDLEERGLCESGWVDGVNLGLGCLFFYKTATHTWEAGSEICRVTYNASHVVIMTDYQFEFIQQELNLLYAGNNALNTAWTAGP